MGQVDTERVERVRAELARARLDAVVCRLAENVLMMTGYWPNVGYAIAIFPLEGEPILIAPRGEDPWIADSWVGDVRTFSIWQENDPPPLEAMNRQLQQAMAERGLTRGRIGYEGGFQYIAPPLLHAEPVVVTDREKAALQAACPDAELVDATPAIDRMRAVKTPREIEKLRIVNEIAAIGLQAWADALEPGRRDIDASAALEAAVIERGTGYKGVRWTRAFPQVASGVKTGGWSYYLPTDTRAMEEGDLAFVELAVVADGFWTDLTRTRAVGGKLKPELHPLWEAQQAGHQAVLQHARPGQLGREVDRRAREAIAAHGLAERFTHHTGHGVGWKYHEPVPMLNKRSEHVLEPGMVFSFEPAVYVPQLGGVRNEDAAVVTADGIEVISPFPVALG